MGNGQADEVPYFSRFSTPTDLLSLWDAFQDWNQKDGKVYYGPTTQEFKEAYSNIAKWYGENLIDKEIYTRGGKARDKLLGDNVGGSTHDWFGSTAQFNDILKESVPGMDFRAFAPPNGKEYSVREEVIAQGAAISAQSEKKEVAIRFMDFIYSETGGRFMNFGIEGEHYDYGRRKTRLSRLGHPWGIKPLSMCWRRPAPAQLSRTFRIFGMKSSG